MVGMLDWREEDEDEGIVGDLCTTFSSYLHLIIPIFLFYLLTIAATTWSHLAAVCDISRVIHLLLLTFMIAVWLPGCC